MDVKEFRERFAERFEEAREQADLSQEAVAAVCLNRDGLPLSREAVSQWGEHLPTLYNAAQAADRLGYSLDWLCGLTETPKGTAGLTEEALELARTFQSLRPQDRKRVQQEAFAGYARKREEEDKDAEGLLRRLQKSV